TDLQDLQHVVQRLDVVDHGWFAEQARDAGERRFVAWLAAVALDGVQQRGLLAADVRAGAAAKLDVEREALPHPFRAEVPAPAGGFDRGLQAPGRQRVLAADVEVAGLAAGRVTRDRHRLDQPE